MPKRPHHIPGSHLEGGGQLVRLALCLSALTSTPIHITDIRGGRPRGGGLKEQHLAALEWLGRACGAEVEETDGGGVKVGSREVFFRPGENSNDWTAPTTLPSGIPALSTTLTLMNPGSITLLLQAVLPFLLLTPTPQNQPYLLHLHGGTNVTFSPSVDYVTSVLLPNLRLFGFPHVELLEGSLLRGYGGGRKGEGLGSASFVVQPLERGRRLPRIKLKQHTRVVKSMSATILASGEARGLLSSALLAATKDLSWAPTTTATPISITSVDSGNPKRLHLLLVAELSTGVKMGRDYLYDKKIGSGSAGVKEAVGRLVEKVVGGLGRDVEEGRVVDEWMEDQLVVFLGLGGGTREGVDVGEEQADEDRNGDEKDNETDGNIEHHQHIPTLHTQTARWLVSELLGVDFDAGGACEGVGLVAGADAR